MPEGMMERVLISRQPIYRADNTVLGYELLFRDSDTDHASFSDGARATAQVLVNSLMEIGLDELVGRHLAFINFERTLLMGNYCESLPSERVVLEILESVEPDKTLLKRLELLRAKGYRIALDDFLCVEPFSPFLEFADFVKVDLVTSDRPSIERAVEIVNRYPLQLIAEKVETREQFQECKMMGFRQFQGYFFCRPQNMTGRPLPVNRLAAIRLLTQLNKPDLRIDELEDTISQNVSLSYKLLRYINSAMCGLERRVESIRHATVLVGLEKMRIWASLIVLSGFEETPREVLVTGVMRARMCEQIATSLHLPHPERHFLVGLFSVLDAILDRPLAQILASLSLSADVADALLHGKSELGNVLRSVQAYERREWTCATGSLSLDEETLSKAYLDALTWSMRTLSGVAERAVTDVTA
jgi:EAL and modified HD-GYP domain-containing signal transduction protein